MIIKLSENIKTFRKERKMTQEQLAEALGVTAGAVYKWERDFSTPDIVLIMELADLFGVSVDVLLGYEWKNSDAGAALDEIKRLSEKRDYSEASSKAEKAIKKYPNNFDIVYQSALMYLSKGESNHDEKAYSRAIELFEHARAFPRKIAVDSADIAELVRQNNEPQFPPGRSNFAQRFFAAGVSGLAAQLVGSGCVAGRSHRHPTSAHTVKVPDGSAAGTCFLRCVPL